MKVVEEVNDVKGLAKHSETNSTVVNVTQLYNDIDTVDTGREGSRDSDTRGRRDRRNRHQGGRDNRRGRDAEQRRYMIR